MSLVLNPSMKARFGTRQHKLDNDLLLDKCRTELRNNLRNMFNFELALRSLKRTDGRDASAIDIKVAVDRMSEVDDVDVKNVFCGDGRAQVDAVNLSKRLTAGEAERYTYANAGAAAIGIATNIAVATADMGVYSAKATGNYDGPKFNDYKFVALSQAGAQPAAHLSAGDRAAFQAREMRELLSLVEHQGDQREAVIELLGDKNRVLCADDEDVIQKLDTLISELEKQTKIPPAIRLAVTPHEPEEVTSFGKPAATADIVVDLTTTAAMRRVQYKQAPVGEKIRYAAKQLAIGGQHAAMSLLGPPAQGLAQYILRKTRKPLNEATVLAQNAGNASNSDTDDIIALLKKSADALLAPIPAADHASNADLRPRALQVPVAVKNIDGVVAAAPHNIGSPSV